MSNEDLQHLLKSAPTKTIRVLHAAIEIATEGMNRNAAFYFILNNREVEEELLNIQEIIENLCPELKATTTWTKEEGNYPTDQMELEAGRRAMNKVYGPTCCDAKPAEHPNPFRPGTWKQ